VAPLSRNQNFDTKYGLTKLHLEEWKIDIEGLGEECKSEGVIMTTSNPSKGRPEVKGDQ
jgi:hypothetical protein